MFAIRTNDLVNGSVASVHIVYFCSVAFAGVDYRGLWSAARQFEAQDGLFNPCSSRIQVVPLFESFRVAAALRKCDDDCKVLSDHRVQLWHQIILGSEWKVVGASWGFSSHMG